MGFLVSPGIQIQEIDLTLVVPGVATTTGALAGIFRWGPIGERVLIDREDALASRFGTPTNLNAETWMTGASFLAYGAAMWVARGANTTSANASVKVQTAYGNSGSVTNTSALPVKNRHDYDGKDGEFDTAITWLAKYPGKLGNSLRVAVCADANSFQSNLALSSFGSGATLAVNTGSNTLTVTIDASSITAANTAALAFEADLAVGDQLLLGNTVIGKQYLKITDVDYTPGSDATGNSTTGTAVLTISLNDIFKRHTNYSTTGTLQRFWEFFSLFKTPPGKSQYQSSFGSNVDDELHAVVVDEGGDFTGTPGEVLEHFLSLSRATDSRNVDNSANYYKYVINHNSQYVWWANDDADAPSDLAADLIATSTTAPLSYRFSGGGDGLAEDATAVSDIARAYDEFVNTEEVDVSLIMTGKSVGGIDGSLLSNYIMDNLTSVRRDCICFVSPSYDDVVNNKGNETVDVVAFRNELRSTSYGFLDSGYKYMYDKYNDVYRWIPLNGDMAGLVALTEFTNDAWWSPAGFNRGHVKNVVKLAWNPRQADRDVLYPAGVNAVVDFPLQGVVLFGDKTLWAKPSAFDRINVRRLFIVLEKAISTMAKFLLFEFNDPFTRAQFKSAVNPFLRDIKGRRGVTDFLVQCDEGNNPGSVIDRNEFVGDIYVKPNRSINFITLRFVAVPTGVAFSENILGSQIPAGAFVS